MHRIECAGYYPLDTEVYASSIILLLKLLQTPQNSTKRRRRIKNDLLHLKLPNKRALKKWKLNILRGPNPSPLTWQVIARLRFLEDFRPSETCFLLIRYLQGSCYGSFCGCKWRFFAFWLCKRHSLFSHLSKLINHMKAENRQLIT